MHYKINSVPSAAAYNCVAVCTCVCVCVVQWRPYVMDFIQDLWHRLLHPWLSFLESEKKSEVYWAPAHLMHFTCVFSFNLSNNLLKDILFSPFNQEGNWGWTWFSHSLNTTEPVSSSTVMLTWIDVHFSKHHIVSCSQELCVFRSRLQPCILVGLVLEKRFINVTKKYA